MGKVYIQAITNLPVEESGISKLLRPGDWFAVGTQQARVWEAAGQCIIHNPVARKAILPLHCGIVLREKYSFSQDGVGVEYGEPAITFEKTLIWQPSFKFNTALLATGFTLLEKWEFAVPISDYNLLARDIGSDEERERTKAIIHDLRVPVYDTRLIFVRQCQAAETWLKLWDEERQQGDERLAFLRAIYKVKPYILALPSVWQKN